MGQKMSRGAYTVIYFGGTEHFDDCSPVVGDGVLQIFGYTGDGNRSLVAAFGGNWRIRAREDHDAAPAQIAKTGRK